MSQRHGVLSQRLLSSFEVFIDLTKVFSHTIEIQKSYPKENLKRNLLKNERVLVRARIWGVWTVDAGVLVFFPFSVCSLQ